MHSRASSSKCALGEFLAISGPSGCGKSPTLLAGFSGCSTAPSEGEYALSGTPVGRLGAEQRARIRNREIGFIFQAFNPIGDLTVYENVELPLTYRENLSRAERRDAALAALDCVGMSHRLNHYPSQLSGGQQQRVAVARALVGRPVDPAGRRAHRKSRLAQWRCGHGTAGTPACQRIDGVHGHA